MKHDGKRRESIHDKICAIESDKLLNKLATDATVCCSKCGARAHDPASLCSPVHLSGSG
jgi:hypothetical protein